jgi:rhodanese-related sulfurtransferase
MKSINYAIYFILFSAVSFIGCAQDSTDKSITVTQLGERMKLDSSLVILDVRNPYELQEYLGHIEGVINIPVQELEKRISELDEYKDNEIAVICRSGRRSLTATSILIQNGFNAVNVEGGMIRFRAEENKEE